MSADPMFDELDVATVKAVEALARHMAFWSTPAGWNDYPDEPLKRHIQRNVWRSKAREYLRVVMPELQTAIREHAAQRLLAAGRDPQRTSTRMFPEEAAEIVRNKTVRAAPGNPSQQIGQST